MKANKKAKNNATLYLNVEADTSEIDEATKKAERLHHLIKEANSLADELSRKKIKTNVSVKTQLVQTDDDF